MSSSKKKWVGRCRARVPEHAIARMFDQALGDEVVKDALARTMLVLVDGLEGRHGQVPSLAR